MNRLRARRALVVALVALALTAPPAGASRVRPSPVKLALGVYGVYGIPVQQQDVGQGPLYGARLKMTFLGALGLEGFYTSFQEGDVAFSTSVGSQTIKGGSQVIYGGNLILGSTAPSGLCPYLTGGVGDYTLAKPARATLHCRGFNGGVGLELRSLPGLAIDLSGRLHVALPAPGGARKFVAVQAGINYYFVH